MKSLRTAFAGFLLMGALAVQAQTADEIIAKHVEAIGGADAWHKVSSIKQEGVLTVQGNIPVNIVTTVLHNKGMRLDLSVMGQSGYQIMIPGGGWNYMPFQGQTKAEPVTEDEARQGADTYDAQGALVDYQKKGNSVTMLGKEDVDGVQTHKLQVQHKSGKVETIFVDPKSFYIIRSVSKQKANGQEMEITSNMANYQKLPEGIVVPMSVSLPQGELVVSKVIVNGPVDEAIFKPTN